MRNALRTASIPLLLLLFVCICIARGADDSAPVSCPESCAGSRKNCELSCSQIVGGGVESGKKRECFGACADEEVSSAERAWLQQLSTQLGLDAATVGRLEKETAYRIAAMPASVQRA